MPHTEQITVCQMTGGPERAFATPDCISSAGDFYPGNPGMTLRDYFAVQALSGLLTGPHVVVYSAHYVANTAYEIADEMMKARSE